jgi:hypothetical protein
VPTRKRRIRAAARRMSPPPYVLGFLRQIHEEHLRMVRHPTVPQAVVFQDDGPAYRAWLAWAIEKSKARRPRDPVKRAIQVVEEALNPPPPTPTHPAIAWLQESRRLSELRSCPTCKRYFFPNTLRMMFCSKKCSNASRDRAAYMREYRQKPQVKLRVKPKVPHRAK